MKNIIKHYSKTFGLIFIVMLSLCFIPDLKIVNCNDFEMEIPNSTNRLLNSKTKSNYNLIKELFTDKIDQFTENGFFNQYYTPSLQATYYVLYILETIGRLDSINQTSIITYIMRQYNEDLNLFMDEYSYRYLDTDFDLKYYSLNSVLETNCYAILSLSILNRTDLINSEEFIDFIWSCFDSNSGGFVGQSLNSDLHPLFRIPTLDNTYFAIKALDVLIDDWILYREQKNNITNFVNNLQCDISSDVFFGGFLNDKNFDLYSLNCFEPNLLSSYYAIKILDLFGLRETIDVNNFHSYLNHMYNLEQNYFNFAGLLPSINHSNIIANSIGLDLSINTNYLDINKSKIISFLLEHQNNLGLWGHSTETEIFQLMDTFQIIRSLKESGNMDILNEYSRDKIANALSIFAYNYGYSLTPHKYTLQSTLNSVIKSFQLHDRISDLEIQELYTQIEKSYFDSDTVQGRGFYACTNLDRYFSDFRSLPLEIYNYGNHIFTSFIDYPNAQKHTYLALDSLILLFKIDDFSKNHNLTELVDSILNCQYFEENSSYYGGFLPFESLQQINNTSKEKLIFLENSYYTIKCLELLSEILDLGSITNMSFNREALFNYINGNIIETASEVYYQPSYNSNTELILKNTYFMIYILQTLNLYDLNNQKIQNFVVNHLNYENLMNIYYSYKISEILNLEISFDLEKTYQMIDLLFIEEINEFKTSTTLNFVQQEGFLWIVEMAKFSSLEIECDYQNYIRLGEVNTIRLNFQNMNLKEFGDYVIIQYEGEQMGTKYFEEQLDKSYQLSLFIPEDPKFFPWIDGTAKIFINGLLKEEIPIRIYTELEQIIIENINISKTYISFEYNISRSLAFEKQCLKNSTLQAQVYYQNNLIDSKEFEKDDFSNYTCFNLDYNCTIEGSFEFKIILTDDFFPSGFDISSIPFEIRLEDEIKENQLIFTGPLLATLCLIISSSTIIISINSVKMIKNKFGKRELKNNKKDIEKKEINNESIHKFVIMEKMYSE